MAETIQFKLEGMIPELEDFEQKGIFSKDEIRLIVKKRTSFEYSLKARQPQLEDFIRYIEYESNLDLLRAKRRQRLGISGKPTISDKAIKKRIISIYERAVLKHRGNVDLWLLYIDHVKGQVKLELSLEKFQLQEQLGHYNVVMKLYSRAIQNFPRSDIFWIEAAKFEFEVNGNERNARKLMQRGLRLNKKSKKIWYEYCKMELIFAERIKARRKILKIDQESNSTDNDQDNSITVPLLEEEQDQDDQNNVRDRNINSLMFEQDEFDKALDSKHFRNKKSKPNQNRSDEDDSIMKTENNPYLKGEVAILIYKYSIKEISNDLEFRKSILNLFNEFGLTSALEIVVNDIKSDFGISNPDAVFYSETALLELSYKFESVEWLEQIASVSKNIDHILSNNYLDITTSSQPKETSNHDNTQSKKAQNNSTDETSSVGMDFESKLIKMEKLNVLTTISELYHSWLIKTFKKLSSNDIKNYFKALISKVFKDSLNYKILSPKISVVHILFLKSSGQSANIKSVVAQALDYNYNLKPGMNINVIFIYLVYLRNLISLPNLLKKAKNGTNPILTEFDSVFNSAINWSRNNSCNNLVIYLEWLKLGEILAKNKFISIDKLHDRYETAIQSSNSFYNQSFEIPDFGFNIDLGFNKSNDNIFFMNEDAFKLIPKSASAPQDEHDFQSLLQVKYINFCNKGLFDKQSNKFNLIAIRNAFDKICLVSKPTLATINYILVIEMSEFDKSLTKIVGNGIVNVSVITSDATLNKFYIQIKKIYDLATNIYNDRQDLWKNYITFLRKIGDFDSANNALFSASQIHRHISV
ncbi:U3 small nucleolar RNA-associated protein 6 [Smittium culicis]|uniref:U3 small nucleolar RNA-associated protein 6 n=1 Tax=Smittium culicis TaxID=133412 RepID=A0A1R1X380_9FUNG|nr:U3 small nucleolar RNA-associated protein 6 [Smittium culicis]